MYVRSSPFFVVFLRFFTLCTAYIPASWTNSSSVPSTRTSITAALPGVNIKPPLSLLTGSSYTSSYTSTPLYNYFTAIASYASISYGLAVFNHTTFQSVCPSSPRSSARACYSTCTSFANACRELHSSWSGRNSAFQSSMNQEQFGGTSSYVGESISTNSDQLTTLWTYDTSWMISLTTVNILSQFGESQRVWPSKILTTVDGVETAWSSMATQPGVGVQTESQAYAVGGTGHIASVKTLENYLVTSTKYYSWSFSEPKPQCSPTTWSQCEFKTDCDRCTISGGTVRLLYFPVSRTSAGGSGVTRAPITAPTPKAASVETAIYGNTTLTSPSVYISFHTVYAMNACGTQIGQRYPGAILALNPNSLSSVNMIWGTMYSTQPADPFASQSPYLIASSFNLADMNWPIPASAYMAQPKCQNGGPWGQCSVILNDYNPLLKVPDEIRAMDPAWRTCELDWQGLYDPPTALHPAEAVAKPTLSSSGIDAGYTSAKPRSTPTSPPVETAAPRETIAFSELGNGPASRIDSSSKVKQSPQSVAGDPDPSVSAVPSAMRFTVSPVETSLASPEAEPSSSGDYREGHLSSEQEDPLSVAPIASDASSPLSTADDPARGHQSSIDSGNKASTSSIIHPLLPPIVDRPTSTQPSPVETLITASEAADEPHSQTLPSIELSSSNTGTLFLDSTGGVNDVMFGDGTNAQAQLSTENEGTGATMFTGSEHGTPLTRTLSESLQPTSMIVHSQGEGQDPGSGNMQDSSTAHPLVAAIDGQTLTQGGAIATVSGGQVASFASDEIVVGSQTLGISSITAGTHRISLEVGSDSALVGLTLMAGKATKTSSIGSGTYATQTSVDSEQTLASTIQRAVFTFGTHKYTAIKTDGPNQAVVDGKTLSVGGGQVSLDGGNVSLRPDGQLEMQPNTMVADTSSTSDGIGSVVQAAAITLAGTTLTVIHPSGARQGVVEVDGTTLSPGGSALVVGDATISAAPKGLVTLGDSGSGTVTLQKTTLTKGRIMSPSSSLASSHQSSALLPSVTSGIGHVQTVNPSPSSSTSRASKSRIGWLVPLALVFVAVAAADAVS